jgi:hypothetical protein
MFKSRTGWLLPLALPALAALAVAIGERAAPATSDGPNDNWDIPRLVVYLNEAGLRLLMVATRKDGDVYPSAFLTTTDKEWIELNRLPKDPGHIDRWRGTLYCEQGPGGDAWSDLARQWGDCCLISGPFLFFGDPALLTRVREVLTESGEAKSRRLAPMSANF